MTDNELEEYYTALETICKYNLRYQASELSEHLRKHYNTADFDDFIYSLTIALHRIVRTRYK